MQDKARPGRSRRWLALASALLALAVAAGYAGERWWVLELFEHFRVQGAFAALALALSAVLLGAHRLAVLNTALAALSAAPVALYLGGPAVPVAERALVRLVSANIDAANTDAARLLDLLQAEDPDVVLLIELRPAMYARLAPALERRYPHRYVQPRPGYFGIGLFSRLPLAGARHFDLDYPDAPAIAARILTARGALTFVGVHLDWPVTPASVSGRNRQLAALGAYLAGLEGPTVLAGDLNLTPWPARFVRLLETANLRDPARRRLLRNTWPSLAPALGIAIDHCLVTPGVAVAGFRVGAAFGSDHRPLIVDLGLE